MAAQNEIIKTGIHSLHFSRLSVRLPLVAVVPTLTLVLGSNLNPMDIEEGDDVYFECNVEANPAAYKIVWKHNVSPSDAMMTTLLPGCCCCCSVA